VGKNEDIRIAIKEAGLKQWQVADVYGLSEGNFSRLLRKELHPEKKEQVLGAIEKTKVNLEKSRRGGMT
jgi:predicted XRE-type DNA-binding protein